MATLALAAVGAAAGSALLPTGIGILGVTLSGATLGSQIGALAGSFIDNALFGSSGASRAVEGPRLSNLQITASTEGANIPRLYGRARLGGQVIWAQDFEEEIVTSTQSSGAGKGVGGGSAGTKVTEYRYYASFAVALCEGPITRIGRVWADGQEIDLSSMTWRLYTGTQTQQPDGLISASLGAPYAPAFRGVAYIVFQKLALAEFGNRVPQFSFEVYRGVAGGEQDIRGVVIIPGSGEFVYATEPVEKRVLEGVSEAVNVHMRQAATDWEAGIDQLQATLPNAESASLVVSWFGTDLRANACQIVPGVEDGSTQTGPLQWSVAGVSRANAYQVSLKDGRPAYGGTPSDETVIAAIRDLAARGFAVTLTPFVMMDVPEGNGLPDPYGGLEQAAYPWRGRITCHPAPDVAGSPDKTAAAATQIAAFVGTAAPSNFSLSGDTVVYSGPNEWSYRRMVLHQAYLAKAAGGVSAFLIGTELRGLTWVRSGPGLYPFVDALTSIAQDVKTILGPGVKVSYAADWSEYFGHQPADGSHDVYFHLDPLWASPAIDAIGVDVYWPLSDWRDGRDHADYVAGYRSIYDLEYLKSNVQGGEGYDWYYASQADRDAQTRAPINDALGKPWIYRYKDVKSWWLNPHFNRPGGIESSTPTAWVPQSKPFWFMEVGCPAVDKGANQPNVFVDPKSSESEYPYYSRRTRDDFMQRRFLQAFIEAFDWTKDGYIAGANPVSTVSGARMVDVARTHIYCWDARPYPAFPQQRDIWGDGDNWQFGHWLNGRLASAPLSELVQQMLADYEFEAFEVGGLFGVVPGYVIDRIMAARDALQPLELGYFFDSIESAGKIHFRHRAGEAAVAELDVDELVETRPGAGLLSLTRGQETELPATAKLRFISAEQDYQQAVAEARRLSSASGRTAQADLAIVLDAPLAGQIAETWLFETWAARERASFVLPPSALSVEPGDLVRLTKDGRERLVRVTEITEGNARSVTALAADPDVYGAVLVSDRPARATIPVQIGSPTLAFLDLPLLTATQEEADGFVASVQIPWPGGVSLYASAQTTGFALKALISAPATMGRTLSTLAGGPEGRIDWANRITVRLSHGALTSADLVSVLGGVNTVAIETSPGAWEVVQFLNATLVGASTYELSGLLRGQAGTGEAIAALLDAGSRFVLLDGAVHSAGIGYDQIGLPYNWRYGPSNRGIGDASYNTEVHAFAGAGLRPYAPVHIRGARSVGGDLTVTWVRRTRSGGDNWDAVDVPLSEENESYEVDILFGSIVKRTIAVSSPSVLYSAAQQIADFGSVQASVSLRVSQMSARYGRGSAGTAIL
ncbi:MAG: glycoside hydrolase/phage tail family protein [Hyphomicrobiaceae bacterium]